MTTKAEKYKEFYQKEFAKHADKFKVNGKIVITNDLIAFITKVAFFIKEQEPIAMELYSDRQLFLFNDSTMLALIIEDGQEKFIPMDVHKYKEISSELKMERMKKVIWGKNESN